MLQLSLCDLLFFFYSEFTNRKVDPGELSHFKVDANYHQEITCPIRSIKRYREMFWEVMTLYPSKSVDDCMADKKPSRQLAYTRRICIFAFHYAHNCISTELVFHIISKKIISDVWNKCLNVNNRQVREADLWKFSFFTDLPRYDSVLNFLLAGDNTDGNKKEPMWEFLLEKRNSKFVKCMNTRTD